MDPIQQKILECFDILEKYEMYDMVSVFRDEFIHAGYLVTLLDGSIDDAELYTLNSMFGTSFTAMELGKMYPDHPSSKDYFLDHVPSTLVKLAELEKKNAFGIQTMLYDTRKIYGALKLGCAMLITCNGQRLRQEIVGVERYLKIMIRYILSVENRLDEDQTQAAEENLKNIATMEKFQGRQYIDNYYKEQERLAKESQGITDSESSMETSATRDDVRSYSNANTNDNGSVSGIASGNFSEQEWGRKVYQPQGNYSADSNGRIAGDTYSDEQEDRNLNVDESGKLNGYMRVYTPSNVDNNVDLSINDAEKLDQLMKELDAMIGLEPVKKEVHNLVNLMRMRMIRKAHGLEVPMVSMHLVFTGNPGTGKTIMARKIAEIYKAIGVLKTGVFVETDRAGLVAGYMGQTAELVHQKVDKASGGVLFIDEAYTLSNLGNEADYGQEAIDTLLKLMEDRREDFVVIVAGYPNEMEKFLSSNPGLRSRFNKFINFEDYSASELFEMFLQLCKKNDYILEKSAEDRLLFILTDMIVKKGNDFANARDMRNLFEKVVTNQANRVIAECPTDLTAITHIIERDLDVEG